LLSSLPRGMVSFFPSFFTWWWRKTNILVQELVIVNQTSSVPDRFRSDPKHSGFPDLTLLLQICYGPSLLPVPMNTIM
jgi:hypothetical protein